MIESKRPNTCHSHTIANRGELTTPFAPPYSEGEERLMRRTIVLLAAIAAMVMVYAGTALAEDTLDAHYSLDGTDPSYSGFNERYKQGQTFTVENTGHLTEAKVTVNRGQ